MEINSAAHETVAKHEQELAEKQDKLKNEIHAEHQHSFSEGLKVFAQGLMGLVQ